MISNRWKILAAALPIMSAVFGTLAIAQPQPGGLGGFYFAWYGDATVPRGPKDYLHFWNPASLDETDQGPGGSDATSYNFDPDAADGWNMGTDDNKYVLTDTPFTNGANYTVTAWVKPDVTAINAQAYGTVVADRYGSTLSIMDFNFILDPPSAGYVMAVVRDNSVNFVTASNTNMPDNVWTHVAAVVDEQNDFVQVFVNGVGGSQTAMTWTPSDVNTNGITIGTLFYSIPSVSTYKFHGSIGKVRLYNRALSQEEIEAEITSDGNTGP